MKISVAIPCRNEESFIEECIDSLYESTLPNDVIMSVFVVDGMSDDNTRKIIKELQNKYSTLFLIDNHKQMTPFAFNLGIKAKEFDYFQIVGARHIISKNYISNCLKRLQSDDSVWCVGGKIENVYVNETGRVVANVMSTSLGMGIGNFRTLSKSGYTDTVTSPMYPSWVFDKIGYFDEELIRNQDDDFNYRVAKAGGKIFFDASIHLKYYVRGSYSNLWKQFNQYGYWKVYVNKKHKAVTTIRQLVPPLFVLYLLFSLLSWLFGGMFGSFSSIPVLIYLLLVLYTSTKIKKEEPLLNTWDIFKTFPLLHISYGLGYLQGILHFIVLRREPSKKNKSMSR